MGIQGGLQWATWSGLFLSVIYSLFIAGGITGASGGTILNLPLPNRLPLTIETDPHLYHRQAAEGETFGVIFQIDLLHGSLGAFV